MISSGSAYPVSDLQPGFFLNRPASPIAPVVLASPHSGRAYPAPFKSESRLSERELRQAEDAYVDQLATPVAEAFGLPLISARWGRAFIDLNRAPAEIDPTMLIDPRPVQHIAVSPRTRAGLGILPRVTGPGLNIYDRKLSLEEVQQRIDAIHAPYHQKLETLLKDARSAHGYALLLDIHSMPSLPLRKRERPLFVIGDVHGTSAPAEVIRSIETALRSDGYSCVRNAPYAGGFTTRHHAAPDNHIFAVQIEIDRALYMDPKSLRLHDGEPRISNTLRAVTFQIMDALQRLYGGNGESIAAE